MLVNITRGKEVMEVDETMFPGQVHHPRFIGERVGRQEQWIETYGPHSKRIGGFPWVCWGCAGGLCHFSAPPQGEVYLRPGVVVAPPVHVHVLAVQVTCHFPVFSLICRRQMKKGAGLVG